ncbi:MAG: FAD-dependent oxidoreductase [Bdellovibrionales bacterium CG10_big_fil_rev_8_21_14_0_10_45_34]|nr:MAG: FAD-dependent oxidoreductase [Bdellovibrionales bacterium CG10_big_fil_rev_8_21_14_0_10_45_34]
MTKSYWMSTHTNPQWRSSKNVRLLSHIEDASKVYWDAVIVGGGIAGISTAFWLHQKDPHLKVLIVDKASLLEGATARNAGFVTCGSIEHFRKLEKQFGTEKALQLWRFSEVNRKLLEENVLSDSEQDFETTGRGACTVANSQEAADLYLSESRRLTNLGIDVEFLDRSQINARLGVKGFEAGILYAHDRGIHPLKVMDAMLTKTEVSILENTPVLRVEESKLGVSVVTPNATIRAGRVVLASSFQISEICRNQRIPLIPQRSQVIVTKPLPLKTHTLCYHTKYLCYFRQMNNGRYLIGGFRNLDLKSEQTVEDGVTSKIQDALERFFLEELSDDSHSTNFVDNRWSGVMGFTPDGQMLLGRVPEHKEVYMIGGCNSHGMGLFFHAGKVLVESFYGGKGIPAEYAPSRNFV